MTGISTLGQALAQIERFKLTQQEFSTLSTQLATGKNTQVFSGLKNNVLVSKSVRAETRTLDHYISNIINSDRRIKLTLESIEEFQQQAENFLNSLTNFTQEGAHQQGDVVYFDDPLTPNVIENDAIGYSSSLPTIELQTLQGLASSVFNFAGSILNRQDGDRYLLAGGETSTKPFVDAGSLDAAVSALLNDWKTGAITTNELISGLESRDATVDSNAVTDSIIGYSLPLSSGNTKDIFIRVDDAIDIDITALANDPAFSDIMVAMAYFKSADLGPIVDEVDPNTFAITTAGAPGANNEESEANFYQVMNDLGALVSGAIDKIDQIRFKLESVRARIEETKQNHLQSQTFLAGQIAKVEDVDINEVAVSINHLQVQLEASYRVTARLSELSLVNFF